MRFSFQSVRQYNDVVYYNNVICNTGMNLASLAECKYLYKATTIW